MDISNKSIYKFISEGLNYLTEKNGEPYARHIDELIEYKNSDASADMTRDALEFYERLINSDEMSSKVMPILVLPLEESLSMTFPESSLVLRGALEVLEPPILYIAERKANDSPYIVEEYKLPIEQDVLRTAKGNVYAYFRAYRYDKEDDYARGLFFEYYPK